MFMSSIANGMLLGNVQYMRIIIVKTPQPIPKMILPGKSAGVVTGSVAI